MASGLSSGFISLLLAENGGESRLTLDRDEGRVDKRMGTITRDLPDLDPVCDMAFVDADQQRPWPLIDTFLHAPHLVGTKMIIRHDLNLYLDSSKTIGVGPGYLRDRWPEEKRERSSLDEGNVFAVRPVSGDGRVGADRR